MNSKLLTRITSVTELKQMLIEIIANNSDKVAKVSDESVLSAIAFGVAKIAQRQNKDTAIIESQLFPELATGTYLDSAALRIAGLTRLGSSGSSTFVRVKASPGTVYIPGVNTFSSKTGIQFEIVNTVTVGSLGFEYIPVRSINSGSNTNVSAQTITTVTPVPVGHISCLNDYAAIGGRDNEQDDSFKLRVMSLPNVVAKGTLLKILESIRLFNPNVLRIFKLGISDNKVLLRIVLENGILLTDSELSEIANNMVDYLPLTNSNESGDAMGITLQNVAWHYIDLDFRVSLSPYYVVSDVRQNIQLNLSKFLDFRYFNPGDKIQWTDLLETVKNTDGVSYVPDEFFTPASDINTIPGELPMFRGFIMRDMSGNIIFDSGVSLTPVFYSYGN